MNNMRSSASGSLYETSIIFRASCRRRPASRQGRHNLATGRRRCDGARPEVSFLIKPAPARWRGLVLVPGLLLIIFCLAFPYHGLAQYPAAEDILKQVDANISSETRVLTSKMIVRGSRGSRTIVSRSWIEGETRSFTEYLAPAREKGTKMLKLGDQLWMYSPDTDRTIQISGHMLRQSVMGSDLSYEDMLEDSKLHEAYDGMVIGEEQVDDRACWILNLTAHTTSPTYYQRKLWVDQEREIPLKEELYAKGGKLLKRLELKDVERIQQRWFPKRLIFKDVLKSGDGTEFIIEDIEFNSAIAPELFTKSSLRR